MKVFVKQMEVKNYLDSVHGVKLLTWFNFVNILTLLCLNVLLNMISDPNLLCEKINTCIATPAEGVT